MVRRAGIFPIKGTVYHSTFENRGILAGLTTFYEQFGFEDE
jgi:hypothetical protein